MILKCLFNVLLSPSFLRIIGIFSLLLSISATAKGLSGYLNDGELWGIYVGIGLLGVVLSALPLIASER
jgi:hypothetical protein